MYGWVRANIDVAHDNSGEYIVVEWRYKQNGSSQWSAWDFLLSNGSDISAEIGYLDNFGVEPYENNRILGGIWVSTSTTNIPWEWAPGDTIEVNVELHASNGALLDTDTDTLIVPGAP
jgi:hypothetical protein